MHARGPGTCWGAGRDVIGASDPRGEEDMGECWWRDWRQTCLDQVSLVPVLMLTLWKEESWEPISCRKSFRELILLISGVLGVLAR